MLTHEIKTARKWVERIAKKVPCSVDRLIVQPESVVIKLKATNEDEVGDLLIAVEGVTGASIDQLPFGGEASFEFTDDNIDVEIQV